VAEKDFTTIYKVRIHLGGASLFKLLALSDQGWRLVVSGAGWRAKSTGAGHDSRLTKDLSDMLDSSNDMPGRIKFLQAPFACTCKISRWGRR
jgi:hypothetical protein